MKFWKLLYWLFMVKISFVNAQTTYNSKQVYTAGDGNNWYLHGTGNGPMIMLRQNIGLGGAVNRRGTLGWMDNNGVMYEYTTWDDAGNFGIGTTSPKAKLDVVGASIFSRNGTGECCSGNNFTIAIAENTYLTGKKASISFHNSGVDEGKVELSNDAGFRSIKFYDHQNQGLGIDVRGRAYIQNSLGIGTTNPGIYKLAVEGTIGARKLKVTQSTWADEVFKPAYKLKSLQEVEQFILKHKHLPDIPSEKQVVGKDMDVGDTQALLLKKIEELTLYIISQQKQINSQATEIEKLKQKK